MSGCVQHTLQNYILCMCDQLILVTYLTFYVYKLQKSFIHSLYRTQYYYYMASFKIDWNVKAKLVYSSYSRHPHSLHLISFHEFSTPEQSFEKNKLWLNKLKSRVASSPLSSDDVNPREKFRNQNTTCELFLIPLLAVHTSLPP